MKNCFLFILLLLSGNLMAQNDTSSNKDFEKKYAVGWQLLGPTKIVSLYFDYAFTNQLGMEVGAGIIGYYGGLHYFITNKNSRPHWAPYTGVFYSRAIAVTGDCNCAFVSKTTGMRSGVYITAGIEHITDNGFSFAIEAAAFFKINTTSPLSPWGSIKMGYHF